MRQRGNSLAFREWLSSCVIAGPEETVAIVSPKMIGKKEFLSILDTLRKSGNRSKLVALTTITYPKSGQEVYAVFADPIVLPTTQEQG